MVPHSRDTMEKTPLQETNEDVVINQLIQIQLGERHVDEGAGNSPRHPTSYRHLLFNYLMTTL